MTTDNYITIILWAIGIFAAVFSYFFVKYDRWNEKINGFLSDLKTGQEVTHLRLQHIESDIKFFKTNHEKIKTEIDLSHSELSTIKSDLSNLKKDFEKWEMKHR